MLKLRVVKICSKCHAEKALSEFYADKRHRDGCQSRCRACVVAGSAALYAAHSEEKLARNAAWAVANPEKVKARDDAFHAANPLYRIWAGMKQRCTNPHATGYKNYGGRGITIGDRWLGRGGFSNFAADMGERPSPKHSLDRIDVDGNYEPSNCRWATASEQNANQRPRVFVADALAVAVELFGRAAGVQFAAFLAVA